MEDPNLEYSSDNASASSADLFPGVPVSMEQNDPLPVKSNHLQHLMSQYQHLLVLHDFHLNEMGLARNLKVAEYYRNVAESIQHVLVQYKILIETLQTK
jgi:hypothetical protein